MCYSVFRVRHCLYLGLTTMVRKQGAQTNVDGGWASTTVEM